MVETITSPIKASVMNLTSGVDWECTDETSSAYIRNKPTELLETLQKEVTELQALRRDIMFRVNMLALPYGNAIRFSNEGAETNAVTIEDETITVDVDTSYMDGETIVLYDLEGFMYE